MLFVLVFVIKREREREKTRKISVKIFFLLFDSREKGVCIFGCLFSLRVLWRYFLFIYLLSYLKLKGKRKRWLVHENEKIITTFFDHIREKLGTNEKIVCSSFGTFFSSLFPIHFFFKLLKSTLFLFSFYLFICLLI